MSKPEHYKSSTSFMRKLLKRLSKKNKVVTLVISSGGDCCNITGCLSKITDDYVILITSDNTCSRAYVLIDCICAVIDQVQAPLPPPPPPVPECECQVTGAANITFPDPPGSPSIVRLTVVACPGCTPGPDQVLYEDNRGEEDIELILLPSGPGEIISVSCEDEQIAVIKGIAQIIIDGEEQEELCKFILEVTDTPPPTPDTMQMIIICEGEEIYDSGVLELLGQSINIQSC